MALYDFAKRIFRCQFKLMGWKLHGIENFPAEGPVVLAINYVSFWDPIVVASSLPRQVFLMVKEELFSVPVLRRILRRLGIFPVKRGQRDINAIRRSLQILKEERVLGFLFEGTLPKDSKDRWGLPGIVVLMERSKAPVVPVKVFGTKHFFRGRGKLAVIIGQPLTAQMLKVPVGVGNRREWIADRIMQAMLELPEAQ